MVSVTIGHGTSLIAPSNIRKTMTNALRTRPVQRASLEVGRVSAMTVMIDPRCLEWLSAFKTNGEGGSRQGHENFRRCHDLPPLSWEKVARAALGGRLLERRCFVSATAPDERFLPRMQSPHPSRSLANASPVHDRPMFN